MIKAKLPRVTEWKTADAKPYSSPLTQLHVNYLQCVSRVQRLSREHVLLPERVPDVVFKSKVGEYIINSMHPLRKLICSSPVVYTPRELSLKEAISAVKHDKCALYYLEAPEGAYGEVAQCKAALSYLECVVCTYDAMKPALVIIELMSAASPITILTVEAFAYHCCSAKLVHTLADDRIYLVGKLAKKEWCGAVAPDDASKLPMLSAQTEATLVTTLGDIYTWRCSTMDKIVYMVNEAHEWGATVRTGRDWLIVLIDSVFKDQSEKWSARINWTLLV